jgi:hypothetical protein
MYSNLSRVADRFERIPLLPRNKDSRLHPQHADWPICGSPPSFPPPTTSEVEDLNQACVIDRLLGLLGPLHQYAISTFNTCSWGLTHQSLTDTGGGYNLGGVSLPHHTLWLSQLTVSAFHERALPGLQFNQIPPTKPKFKIKNLRPPYGLPTTQPSTVAYIYA